MRGSEKDEELLCDPIVTSTKLKEARMPSNARSTPIKPELDLAVGYWRELTIQILDQLDTPKRGSDSDTSCRGYGTPSDVFSKGTPAQREYVNWRVPTHTFHTSIAQPYLDDLIASVKGNMHSAGMVQHLCIINVYHFVKRAFSYCMCLSSQELFRRRRKSSGPDPI